jgi:hypothetical protein
MATEEALDEVRVEVHRMGLEIAGLRPIVQEVHSSMPRIVQALETLAGVTARLETNTEDHRHLHDRINSIEEKIREERVENIEGHRVIHRRINETDVIAKEMRDDFDALRDEHIVCTTTQKVTRTVEKEGLWAKIKKVFTDKSLELVVYAILGFTAWMVLSHLGDYQKSKQVSDIVNNQGGV